MIQKHGINRSSTKQNRDIEAEILGVLDDGQVMSKNRIAREVVARKADVLRAVDRLEYEGLLVERVGGWRLRGARPGPRSRTPRAQLDERTPAHKHHLRTPAVVLDRLRAFGDIGLDPCAAPRNHVPAHLEWRGPAYPEEDGLARRWTGYGFVYCFPPPHDIARWARKIAREARAGVELLALLPSRTDTRWQHDYILPNSAATCYWRGRLRAVGERSRHVGPRALHYFGSRVPVFRSAFADAGSIVLGSDVARSHTWRIVLPRPTPSGSWVQQQGRNSKLVTQCRKRFAQELKLASLVARCPPANEWRKVVITRFGIRAMARPSLRSGGELLETLLVDRGAALGSTRLPTRMAPGRRRAQPAHRSGDTPRRLTRPAHSPRRPKSDYYLRGRGQGRAIRTGFCDLRCDGETQAS